MIIRSIRLHPFAGTSDRTFTFSDGLNVLSGENEFGKSTLYNALQEVLFAGTDQTPAVMRDWGSRWYPKPGGDHARVSLSFEAEGKTWQLEKVWGAGKQSLLREEGGTSLADPLAVSNKINSLLRWNKATWTRVLFTRQAELAKTIDELKGKGNLLTEVDDLETQLKGMAAIPGDVPAERLKALLDIEINRQNHRWEVENARPKDGRGIGNPWSDIVTNGATIRAYYAKESALLRLDSLRNQEAEIQSATDRLKKLELQGEADREFCKVADVISTGLSSRSITEANLAKLRLEADNARRDFQNWPVLSQEIKSAEDSIFRLKPEITNLEEELSVAKKREKGKSHVITYQQITDETKTIGDMKAAFALLPEPDEMLIQQWEKIIRERENTRMQILALKLKISLLSKTKISARIQEGLNPEQTIQLEKDTKWESEASGRFHLYYEGLELTVENGELDMDSLTKNLRKLEEEEKEMKNRSGFESPGEATQALNHRKGKKVEIEQKEILLNRLMQNRTRAEWDTWHSDYQQLPATRDEGVLGREISEKNKELNHKEANLQNQKNVLQALELQYGNADKLMEIIIQKKAEMNKAESDLLALPALPSGFSSVQQFLNEHLERKQRNAASLEQERKLKEQIITISASLPDDNADELEADFLMKEKLFQREKERSLALLRIRKTLDEVLMKREEADPQQILAASVSGRFKRLSRESYKSIRLGEEMQAKGKTALPFQTLSRGTLGSLALAIRLSLGDLYLEDMKGLVVLDDPFTDMDEGRRAAAVKEIRDFSEKSQVLLLTCHENHKAELLSSGAVSIKVD